MAMSDDELRLARARSLSLARARTLAKGAAAAPSGEAPVPNEDAKDSRLDQDPNQRGGSTDLLAAGIPFSDEIMAGGLSAIDAVRRLMRGERPKMAQDYNRRHNEVQGRVAEAEKDYGAAATPIELLGGLAGGGTAVKGASLAAEGIGIGGQIARGAAGGGLWGAAAGAGEGAPAGSDASLSDNLVTRGENALAGGITGAATGGVLSGVVPAAQAITRKVSAPFRAAANPIETAATKVGEAFQRDNLDPLIAQRQLAGAVQDKPDTMLADIGSTNTHKLLRAATNVPGEARTGMVQAVERRQKGQLNRQRDDIGAAFGDTQQFFQTTEQLAATRKANADPLWRQAYDTPTPYTRDLQNVLQRPLMQKLLGRTREGALNRGEDLGGFFAQETAPGVFDVSRVPQTQDLHRIRMELNRTIENVRAGKESGIQNATYQDLMDLKRTFDRSIQNPNFHTAVKAYADDSAAGNALELGRDKGMKLEPEEIQKTLADLDPGDRDMWRLGFARDVVERLRDSGRTGTNRADVIDSPKFMERLIAAFPDKAARQTFVRNLRLEQRMARTRNAVQGNSSTQSQQIEGQEAAQEAEHIIDTTFKVATGNWSGALMGYLTRAKNAFTGLTPKTANEIVRLLGTQKPAEVARARALIEMAESKAKAAGARNRGTNALATTAGVVGADETRRQLSAR